MGLAWSPAGFHSEAYIPENSERERSFEDLETIQWAARTMRERLSLPTSLRATITRKVQVWVCLMSIRAAFVELSYEY